MAASFPSAIKSFITRVDGQGNIIYAQYMNDIQDEIAAIEAELGIDPAGSAATVKDRIAALELVNWIAMTEQSSTPATPAAGTKLLYPKTDGKLYTLNSAGVETEVGSGSGGSGGIGMNYLVNGGFRIAQRGASFDSTTTPANSDDTYLLDRWILLSDGNDIVDVSQESSVVPDGALAAIKLEVETASKQFGILQILESKEAALFAGKKASLSFKARMAAADDNTHSLKAVVLAWNSTADVVTSDVISSWGASPTFATNWTAENTAASSNTLTTSWQTFEIENISIDTVSMANLAVLIFCDQVDGAVDDAVYVTDVKLEIGESATDYENRLYADEFSICQRYFQTLKFDNLFCVSVYSTGKQVNADDKIFPTTMRVAPTFSHAFTTFVSTTPVNYGEWAVYGAGYSTASGISTLHANITANKFLVSGQDTGGFSGLTQGQFYRMIFNNTTPFYFDSEL
jgi:hypothetical protein